MATFTALATFTNSQGSSPSGLTIDAAGDLFGTMTEGGANDGGTVFEIAKTASGYAAAPTILASLPADDFPEGGVTLDSAGDVFGTTQDGGADTAGSVFEIAKTASGYAAPTTLASFNGNTDGLSPAGTLLEDASGDLIGTAPEGGIAGVVFEVAKTSTGYAAAPTTLATFNGLDGEDPRGGLIADAKGDLFGTTLEVQGSNNRGGVFELAKTATGYATTPTLLAAFDGVDGQYPNGGLVMDAAGNLYGTTSEGGSGDGTIFEIRALGNGTYASTPIVLVNFNGADGADPSAGLLIDGAGNLYGTTTSGGTGDGTVFELPRINGQYAAAPTTLVAFDSATGANPTAALSVDSAGNLYGTTSNAGGGNDGTAFELTNTGFRVEKLSTLVNLPIALEAPPAGLTIDAAGDLFGVSSAGGANSDGAVFELVKTNGSYAAAPQTLASFTPAEGAMPDSPLVMDEAGNLYGTTRQSGTNGFGTVFEIAKTASGFAPTPTTLFSFTETTGGDGVTFDAAGDILLVSGTGGANGDGMLYELAKTASGYASTPTTLASFTAGNADPSGALVANGAGDLFGVTDAGGALSLGTVFEIAETATGYATPVTLLTFDGTADGANPIALAMDSAGDLFGSTAFGGKYDDGVIFELKDLAGSYAAAPAVLYNFQSTTLGGPEPYANQLVIDTEGDLFGTTEAGGANENGSVFELANTGNGYAGTIATLGTFDYQTNGYTPVGALVADTQGNLYGATEDGGTSRGGTLFEVSGTGFQVPAATTLVNLNPTGLADPKGGLISDANGDLIGTTFLSGQDGAVFAVDKTGNGYAATPVTIATLNGSDGSFPFGTLVADRFGDLFGTAVTGGADSDGTVFEVVNAASGYSSTPKTIVSFNGLDGATPDSGLITDVADDLFGETYGGGPNGAQGTVFEIVDSGAGYAATPTVLASFTGANGIGPEGGLISDARGDLFGVTASGGSSSGGTVFEIVHTPTGYAAPTTLADFTGNNGEMPMGGLVADAQGDLFGTTAGGGADQDGTVFEIPKTLGGYGTLETLVSFNGTDGANPGLGYDPTGGFTFLGDANLIIDAAGNLYGTTAAGGADDDGTVFELAHTAGGYASTPTMLLTFNQSNGAGPISGLFADQAGNLYGTTTGNALGTPAQDLGAAGTVFEITGTGFVTNAAAPQAVGDFFGAGSSDLLWQNASSGEIAIWQMNGGTAANATTIGNVPSGWQVAGEGDFAGDGMAEILWQNTAEGEIAIWQMNGATAVNASVIANIPFASGWQIAGIGDFYGTGTDDILWRNPGTGAVAVWEMNANTAVSYATIGTAPADWKVAAVGDVTGGGTDDILWQNTTTGQVAIWDMQGSSVTAYNNDIGVAPSGWSIAGLGDFDGNGADDILWQNPGAGEVAVWQTDGTTMTQASTIAGSVPFGSGWQVAGVGDYYGTGTDSILWQNSLTGQAALWQTNGSSLIAATTFAGGIPSGWQIAHNPVLAG